MPRALLVALFVSLAVHALALFGPQMSLPHAGEPSPLVATLRLPPPSTRSEAAGEVAGKPPAARPARQRPARQALPAGESAISAAPPPSALPAEAPPQDEPALDAPAAGEDGDAGEPPAAAQAAAPGEAGQLPVGAGWTAGDETAGVGQAEAPRFVVTAHLPARGSIRYRVDRGDRGFQIGVAQQEWEATADSYRISTVSETSGLAALFKRVRVEAESRGRVDQGGLVPEHFVVRRKGRDSAERIDFDWRTGQLRMGDRPPVALPAGTQDILSLNFQLALLPEHAGVALSVATGRKLARYRLEVVGEETIETPAGSFRSLHLRVPGTATTELWLAYAHALLPVKVRHVDRKGDVFVQSATHIDFVRDP